MKYRQKSLIIDATQWHQNGDHPDDDCYDLEIESDETIWSEGKVVRYYRDPYHEGTSICSTCEKIMHYHGWIDDGPGGHIVCPGDWIVTGMKGEYRPCKPDIFEATYENI